MSHSFREQPAVFGVPGGGPSLQLVEMFESVGTPVLVPGHEMTASLMAAGLAAVTGRAGLCFSIKGPGFANLAPGLLCARAELRPVVAVSEAYAPDSARRHKWMEHAQWSQQACKRSFGYYEGVGDAARALAESWPPGPCLIELAERTQTEPVFPAAAELSPSVRKHWMGAKQPALILGSGAAGSQLVAAAKDFQFPVFTTPAAKGLVDERLPQAAGIYTGAGRDHTSEAVLTQQADGLIFVGVTAGELLDVEPRHEHALFLSPVSTDQVFPPCSLQDRSIAIGQDQLLELSMDLSSKAWGRPRQVHRSMVDAVEAVGFTPALLQHRIFSEPRNITHVLDTGCFTVTGEHLLPATAEQRVIGTPNSRTMGAGLGMALGAACCGPTILWIGDGGARVAGLELGLAVQHELPLLVLHLRDGGFGSIKAARSSPPKALNLPGTPRGWAEGLGFAVVQVARYDEAEQAILHWLKEPKALFMDIAFEPSSYREVASLLR